MLDRLRATIGGLSGEDARMRREMYGANTLPRQRPLSDTRLFFSQFRNPLVAIFILAGAVSLFLGHYSDAIFITIVLLINTSVGFYQERKANRSLAALKRLVTVSARVLRDGSVHEIDAEHLVPGDIVLLRAGDKVSADVRLLEAHGLSANESALTGEWVSVVKQTAPVRKDTPLAERSSMLFMGTVIEEGSAKGVVVETGVRTAFGEIVSLVQQTDERRTPLQQQIATMSRWAGGFVVVVVLVVLLLGYLGGRPFGEVFVAALALAVSAIPAGLLPAITVILVLGMRRILREKGLVRRLIANETLGSVTVICTDKTGTLTLGTMQVARILTGSRELLSEGDNPIVDAREGNGFESHIVALKAAVLANAGFIEDGDSDAAGLRTWLVRGSATEKALLLAGAHAGLFKSTLETMYPRLAMRDFDHTSKFAASLHRNVGGGTVLFAVGAPEELAKRSVSLYVDGHEEPFDSDTYRALTQKLDTLTTEGLRVLACARREWKSVSGGRHAADDPDKLTLLGYIALKDPLRHDARASIEASMRAGIRPLLITGDHPHTARAVAREVGIETRSGSLLEGRQLDELTDEALVGVMSNISICARVSPRHKLRIVQALQKRREVVAMLGDGVNDAPALKAADVGIAVGSGTDVAKEVADIVLLDDNFKTVLHAIREGRIIFQNVRKVFAYLMADDFAELFLFLAALSFGLPVPLLAAQILWINLVEDGLPDIALTTEKEADGIMEEKPRSPNEPILNRALTKWLAAIFVISGSAALFVFAVPLMLGSTLEGARTLVFALMTIDSLIFVFSVRSFRRSIFRRDIFSNLLLDGAAMVGLVLLLGSIYMPSLQRLLGTVPLGVLDWIGILIVSCMEIALIELAKQYCFGPSSKPRSGKTTKTPVLA